MSTTFEECREECASREAAIARASETEANTYLMPTVYSEDGRWYVQWADVVSDEHVFDIDED